MVTVESERKLEARSLVNRAHNAIGSGKYDRATVRDWLRQADDLLKTPSTDSERLETAVGLLRRWLESHPDDAAHSLIGDATMTFLATYDAAKEGG